jgi:hypothetical protein
MSVGIEILNKICGICLTLPDSVTNNMSRMLLKVLEVLRKVIT